MIEKTIDDIVADARNLDLSIDENNLLPEWQGQGALMLEYGIWLADAIEDEDDAKMELGITIATLDRKIREDPTAYGLAKATETTVPNAIPGQKEHQAAMGRLIASKHKVRVLRAVTDSLDHRRSSLKGMTEVFMRQWFADPHSSEQPEELRKNTRERASDEQTQNMTGPPTKVIKGRRKRTR